MLQITSRAFIRVVLGNLADMVNKPGKVDKFPKPILAHSVAFVFDNTAVLVTYEDQH